jgi:beta-1,4-mannooligosaccharide/beta-1,4-mannosyl-N-acetylglucosamine phosphorylase
MDGVYYILFTAVSAFGPMIEIAKTKDFKKYERIALVSAPGNKDGVLFPEKINGKYARLDRPIGNDIGSIWISYSDDLTYWGHSKAIITPRPGYWDSYRIGASVPPIKTDKGWLEIYHGKGKDQIYSLHLLLLDLNDPSHVLKRGKEPILFPEEPYETRGFFPNVVFSNGVIAGADGSLKIYYGACDETVCLAEAMIDELLEALK